MVKVDPKALLWLLIGSILGAVALCALMIVVVALREPRPPRLAGQSTPDQLVRIDFEKRYDLYCASSDGEATVFRGCRVLGFTGRQADDEDDYAPAVSWVVIELADSRRAYLPVHLIRWFEETA